MCAVDQLPFRALERAFFVGMRQSWISGVECAFIFSVKSTATWAISVVPGTQVRIAFLIIFFKRHSSHKCLLPDAETARRICDRKDFADTQIRRWGRLLAKTFVIVVENAIGEIINRQPFLRKVFAAAFKQGLQHLEDMQWAGDRQTVRLLKYTGASEANLDSFFRAHTEEICRLNDTDHYAIVAAGMLRGTQPRTISHTIVTNYKYVLTFKP